MKAKDFDKNFPTDTSALSLHFPAQRAVPLCHSIPRRSKPFAAMADQDSVLPGASANLDAAMIVVDDMPVDTSATIADEALPTEATSINSVSATSLEPDVTLS